MLPVTKIQRFSTQDGPGVRTTVFLKGCPLRCLWCHNPETATDAPMLFYSGNLCLGCGRCAAVCENGAHFFSREGHVWDPSSCVGCMKCVDVCVSGALESCCRFMTADRIFDEVMRDAVFYGDNGGVTFSGGEPVVHADELLPLMRRFREEAHITVTLETCGYFNPAYIPELAAATDLFFWDIKDTDDERHKTGTGVPPGRILDNLRTVDSLGARTVLRCIMLKTVNMNVTHLENIAGICASLRHCDGVELIPYHDYAVSKYAQIGRKGISRPEWVPSDSDMREAEDFLKRKVPTTRK